MDRRRGAWRRLGAALRVNLGLKLVAIVVAIVLFVLVHRQGGRTSSEVPTPVCPPPAEGAP